MGWYLVTQSGSAGFCWKPPDISSTCTEAFQGLIGSVTFSFGLEVLQLLQQADPGRRAQAVHELPGLVRKVQLLRFDFAPVCTEGTSVQLTRSGHATGQERAH